jgi:hypothetical protein
LITWFALAACKDEPADEGLSDELLAVCEVVFERVLECLPETAAELDDEACEEIFAEPAAVGPACAEAMAQWWSCSVLALSCEELQAGPIPDGCPAERVRAVEACPGTLPLCNDAVRDATPNGCRVEATECPDDHAYAIECMGSGPFDCACTIDGQTSGRYITSMSCVDGAAFSPASEACDFPPGIP